MTMKIGSPTTTYDDSSSGVSVSDLTGLEDVEIACEDPPMESKALTVTDAPKYQYICGIPMAPLLLRDDAGRPLRQSLRKHRLVMLALVFVILIVVIALVTTVFLKPGGQASSNSMPVPTAKEGKINKWDLQRICPKGATTFSAANITEDVIRRQTEFAAMIADGGVNADLSPVSCSPENLAVLYLAANPPKNLNRHLLMDRYALITFYISLGGWKWKEHDNWLGDGYLCTWFGVTCDDSGALTGITLRHNNLNGKLPEMLTYVSSLQVLNLAQNSITGTLPTSIHQLRNLLTLEISINKFSGEVPTNLWKLSNIEIVNLAHFGGTVPTIPPEIGRLSSLQRLLVPETHASGFIPTEIGECQSLRFLDLASNQLKSPIPTELGALSMLQSLYLSANLFDSYDMPPEICSRLSASGGKLLAFDMKARCLAS